MFVEIAKRRIEVFSNLNSYLDRIKQSVLKTDPHSELYLFGSVAKGTSNMASDIDILVITELNRDNIQMVLDREGIGFPFEFHIRNRETAEPYFRHVNELKRL